LIVLALDLLQFIKYLMPIRQKLFLFGIVSIVRKAYINLWLCVMNWSRLWDVKELLPLFVTTQAHLGKHSLDPRHGCLLQVWTMNITTHLFDVSKAIPQTEDRKTPPPAKEAAFQQGGGSLAGFNGGETVHARKG